MKKPKVLILGGGFGGLNAAKSLKNPISTCGWSTGRTSICFNLYYTKSQAPPFLRAISPMPIREILRSSTTSQSSWRKSRDRAPNSQVKIENGEILVYDYLIGALGARHVISAMRTGNISPPGLKLFPMRSISASESSYPLNWRSAVRIGKKPTNTSISQSSEAARRESKWPGRSPRSRERACFAISAESTLRTPMFT